ncbi:MAG: hypothetical protein ACJA01_002180 [Saprospiraceae bacterium]|jgi:hypothetical protein
MTGIEIVSERIKLRLIEISDLNSIHELHYLPKQMNIMPWEFQIILKKLNQ